MNLHEIPSTQEEWEACLDEPIQQLIAAREQVFQAIQAVQDAHVEYTAGLEVRQELAAGTDESTADDFRPGPHFGAAIIARLPKVPADKFPFFGARLLLDRGGQ